MRGVISDDYSRTIVKRRSVCRIKRSVLAKRKTRACKNCKRAEIILYTFKEVFNDDRQKGDFSISDSIGR